MRRRRGLGWLLACACLGTAAACAFYDEDASLEGPGSRAGSSAVGASGQSVVSGSGGLAGEGGAAGDAPDTPTAGGTGPAAGGGTGDSSAVAGDGGEAANAGTGPSGGASPSGGAGPDVGGFGPLGGAVSVGGTASIGGATSTGGVPPSGGDAPGGGAPTGGGDVGGEGGAGGAPVLVGPDTVIVSGPSAFVATVEASFELSSPDVGVTFECSLDGGAYQACGVTFVLTVGEGPHRLEARAVDGVGAFDSSPAFHDWTVDLTEPETTITDAPPVVDSSAEPVFGFASDESDTTFECNLDGGGWVACTSGDTLPAIVAGEHTFEVRAVDRAGNVDSTPAEHVWTYDDTLPDTFVGSDRGALTNQTSVELTFAASEEGATFECRLDGGTWESCTSPATRTGLAEGEHVFEVRAIDGAERADPSPAAVSWRIDLTPPETTLTGAPGDPDNDTTPTFSFVSEGGATFQCRRDAAAWEGCTSPFTWPTTTEGAHTFRVRAVDAAGNADPTEASHAWSIVTTGPATTITAGPSVPTASTEASFSFSSSAGATFQCQLEGESTWAPCVSPKSYSGLTQGPHTFSVYASDGLGNSGAVASRSWSVDTVGPNPPTLSCPTGCQTINTASIGLTASEAGSTVECQLDGGSWAGCASPASYTGLSQGNHTFAARGKDALGNVGSATNCSWSVDTVAPDTACAGPTSPQTSCAYPFSFTFSGGDSHECNIDGGGYATCTSPRSLSWTTGAHTFLVRARDSCGNYDAEPCSWPLTVNTCGAGCACSGATATETNCSDGADNDYDGALNCADSNCNGVSCGSGSGSLAITQDCQRTSGGGTDCALATVNVVSDGVGANWASFDVTAPPSSTGVSYAGTFTVYLQLSGGSGGRVKVSRSTTTLGTCNEPSSGMVACSVSLTPILNAVAGTGTFQINVMPDTTDMNAVSVLMTETGGTSYDPAVSYTYSSVCTSGSCPAP